MEKCYAAPVVTEIAQALGDFFIQSLTAAMPGLRLGGKMNLFAAEKFQETLLADGVDPNIVAKGIEYACKNEDLKRQMAEYSYPHWVIIKNWNKIAYALSQAKREKPTETSELTETEKASLRKWYETQGTLPDAKTATAIEWQREITTTEEANQEMLKGLQKLGIHNPELFIRKIKNKTANPADLLK